MVTRVSVLLALFIVVSVVLQSDAFIFSGRSTKSMMNTTAFLSPRTTQPPMMNTTALVQPQTTKDWCNMDRYLACFGHGDPENITFEETYQLACGPNSTAYYDCLTREINRLRPCPYLPDNLPAQLNFTSAKNNPMCNRIKAEVENLSMCVSNVSVYDPYLKCVTNASHDVLNDICRLSQHTLRCFIKSIRRFCPTLLDLFVDTNKPSYEEICKLDWDYIFDNATAAPPTAGTNIALQQLLTSIQLQASNLEQLSQSLITQLKLAETLATGSSSIMKQTLNTLEQQAGTLPTYINSLISELKLASTLT